MRDRGRTLDTGWVGAGEEDDLDRRLAEEEEPFDLRRPHVMTVLGPIEPGALGVTLVDERLTGAPPDGRDDRDLRLDDPHASLAELEDFYAAGGRAVVDGTAPDQGRDAAALRWIAARAPAHLIAVTGRDLSRTDRPETYPIRSTETVSANLVSELTKGMGETDARAGAIAIGIAGDVLAHAAESLLRGAAGARRGTGAPVLLRVPGGRLALDALAILAGEGIGAEATIVGGLRGRSDAGELRSLLGAGAFVAFDRVGREDGWPASDQAATIRDLVGAGFGDQILLSAGLRRRSALRAYGGGPGWVGTLERFPLLLMEAGLDAPAVRRLLVDNPARALTIAPPGMERA
jgi:phosphotriesterase-related protein